jgi:hypothetical protein
MGYDTVRIVNFFQLLTPWRQNQQDAPQSRAKKYQSERRHIREDLTVKKLSILKIDRQLHYSLIVILQSGVDVTDRINIITSHQTASSIQLLQDTASLALFPLFSLY